MKNQTLLLFLLLALATACNPANRQARKQAKNMDIAFEQKPTIVYKTKADYRDKVPILLSEDGKTVLSYPAPSDLFIGKELAKPIELYDGYLLDRRGIGPRVAFLDISYMAYARLPNTPKPKDLLGMLLETDPLTACYDCGNIRAVDKLNVLIKGKGLGKCRDLME